MKANGRRRWRKWSARSRQRYRRTAKREGYKLHPDELKKHKGVHLKERKVCGILPPLHAREFSARSLCGMTQGARKRAARICPGCIECRNVIPEIDFGLRCDSSGVFAQSPEQWRRRYKIGQRLRPCPGCESCLGRECIGCEGGQLFEGDVCERCRRTATGERICDGSGVLPAKRHRRCGWWLNTRTAKNATQRCGMPLTSGGWLDCQHCGGSGWLMGRGE